MHEQLGSYPLEMIKDTSYEPCRCGVCCVVFNIFDLAKPTGVACENLTFSADGLALCKIYANRPEDCVQYSCYGERDRMKTVLNILILDQIAGRTGPQTEVLDDNNFVGPQLPEKVLTMRYDSQQITDSLSQPHVLAQSQLYQHLTNPSFFRFGLAEIAKEISIPPREPGYEFPSDDTLKAFGVLDCLRRASLNDARRTILTGRNAVIVDAGRHNETPQWERTTTFLEKTVDLNPRFRIGISKYLNGEENPLQGLRYKRRCGIKGVLAAYQTPDLDQSLRSLIRH